MGYFSNGTEGDMYREKWCERCVHGIAGGDDLGCPVWDAHLLYAYRLCNEKPAANPGKAMLDMLIPREGLGNGQCAMFIESRGGEA